LFRPSPTSTFFPYTTLFRSNAHAVVVVVGSDQILKAVAVDVCHGEGWPFPDRRRLEGVLRRRELRAKPVVALSCLGRDAQQKRPDRKSTRLNSSHLVISYAV